MKDHGKPSKKVKPLGVAEDSLHFRITFFFYQYRTSIRRHSVSVSSGKWRLRKRALSLSPSFETFFIVRVTIPHSHIWTPFIKCPSKWSTVINYPYHWSTIPAKDQLSRSQFLARISGRIEEKESRIRNPESRIQNLETESGNGKINEWFRFCKYDWHQYGISLLSAFLARWMMIYGALLRKGRSIKNILIIVLFS